MDKMQRAHMARDAWGRAHLGEMQRGCTCISSPSFCSARLMRVSTSAGLRRKFSMLKAYTETQAMPRSKHHSRASSNCMDTKLLHFERVGQRPKAGALQDPLVLRLAQSHIFGSALKDHDEKIAVANCTVL